jgi:spermidine synthase
MALFFIFFLISGACSLIYEIIWLRLSMATFGVNAPLVSIFLSIFMAGLGIGSLGAGFLTKRLADRQPSFFIRLYALTELMIAISALIVPYLIGFSQSLLAEKFAWMYWGSLEFYGISALLITIFVLPWCVCMGATIPFAMAAVRLSKPAASERSFSFLYRANVLGAIFGTIAASFIMVELVGLINTLLLTAIINFIIAGTALIYSYHILNLTINKPVALDSLGSQLGNVSSSSYLLVLVFITGFVSMAMEIIWIRMFIKLFSTTVYAFALILISYLVGTALGTSIYRDTAEKKILGREGLIWSITGLLGLIPISILFFDSYNVVLSFIQALVILGITAFSGAIGFLTPMLVDRWSQGNPYQAGSAYAINILGCILGPLLVGFILLPRVSESTALILVVLPLFLAGWSSAFQQMRRKPQRFRWQPGNSLVAAVTVISLLFALVSLSYENKLESDVVMKRDYEAQVVARGQGMEKKLSVNGISMTKLTPITKFMAHLPLSLLPGAPENSLVICFGMGTTFRSFLSWGIESTAVDLIPSVPALFGYFHSDFEGLTNSPKAKIVIDDGRRFLKRTKDRYDVIAIDPPPPVECAYSSLLYSQEFYEIVKSHLKPGGILQQWLPRGDKATQIAVVRALKESFPHVRVFISIENWGFHYLASDRPILVRTASEMAQLLPPPAQKDAQEWGPYSGAEKYFQKILDNEISIESIIGSNSKVPALTDNTPVNEYFALRRIFRN